MAQRMAEMTYEAGNGGAVLEFLKRTRSELRSLRRVQVSRDWLRVFDINGDYFEVQGLGYENPDLVPALKMINTSFNPETLHQPTAEPFKEFLTGRRYPWAHDRVM